MSEKSYDPELEVPFNESEISDRVRLPVGLEVDGVRYRDLIIDEMTGIDDHNLASKKSGNNGAKGITVMISRCVQEVIDNPNYPRKQNSEKLFDRKFARSLTIIDRDFLLAQIYLYSGEEEVIQAGVCPRCDTPYEEPVQLADLEVVEWPDESPLEIEFELPRGYVHQGKTHKQGALRFPTGKEQEKVGDIQNPAQVFDALFAACLVRLGDITSFDQEMMKRMKSMDRRYLMNYLQTALPGLRQWKTVRCKCGREFEIHADLTSFFDGRRKTAS